MTNISEKVIIIMGASSGIGEATAKLLASKGAKLVLAARREERIKALAEDLGEQVFYQKADVTDRQQVQQVIDLAMEKFGRIDVMYNNAGIMPQGNLAKLEYVSWQKMLDINIMGVLNGIGAVLPIMQNQQSGLIISTDSVAGHVVYPGSAVYNGTKYAVGAIMEGLRQEELSNGIRSTIVSPGMVSSELFNTVGDETTEMALRETAGKAGFSLAAADVAQAVLYAIEQPEHVTISEVLLRPAKQSI
ncbi:SDR family oxidoreductase [Enterococcus xiangfangensis]|uniref:SDR family oxidoreductase n=1 Tax=Enterococcus xiangfangensis TaxID=1296537 RepID=UPI0010F620C1|nr:SDR family oxidoreductase [Enterococcus xiangfangensis]MBM7711189.1 NADP-dependent 3-hydroxy acid dehydrogenase YdfG [Enterococcus xiangfangensis]NBK09251.1 SDR family oxidoreductase [Enterococcus asini]